jgi:hypothetical protein
LTLGLNGNTFLSLARRAWLALVQHGEVLLRWTSAKT